MQRRKGAAKRAAAATGGAAGPEIDESMEPEPEEEEDTSTRGKARLTMMGACSSLSPASLCTAFGGALGGDRVVAWWRCASPGRAHAPLADPFSPARHAQRRSSCWV